jgi:hypothetical protein
MEPVLHRVLRGCIPGLIGSALLLGDNEEFGDTLWRLVDSVFLASATTGMLKLGFRRQPPPRRTIQTSFFPAGRRTTASRVAR